MFLNNVILKHRILFPRFKYVVQCTFSSVLAYGILLLPFIVSKNQMIFGSRKMTELGKDLIFDIKSMQNYFITHKLYYKF